MLLSAFTDLPQALGDIEDADIPQASIGSRCECARVRSPFLVVARRTSDFRGGFSLRASIDDRALLRFCCYFLGVCGAG